MAQAGELFREKIQLEINRLTWTVLPTNVKIQISSYKGDAGYAGIVGASLALRSSTK